MPLEPQMASVLVLAAVAAVVLLTAWMLVLHRSFIAQRRRLRSVLGAGDQRGIDEVLHGIVERLEKTGQRLDALNALHQELEGLLRRGTVRNVGLVRFNPFPDAGGDQSFAIALLDGQATGIVVSSLHARAETRVFAKPVEGGRSRYPLSDEEQDAIRRALEPGVRSMG